MNEASPHPDFEAIEVEPGIYRDVPKVSAYYRLETDLAIAKQEIECLTQQLQAAREIIDIAFTSLEDWSYTSNEWGSLNDKEEAWSQRAEEWLRSVGDSVSTHDP